MKKNQVEEDYTEVLRLGGKKKGDVTLSPGQKRMDDFYKKKLKVEGSGLSMDFRNTKQTKGAGNSPLEGVQDSCTSKAKTSGGTEPPPVERGGVQ